MQRPIKFRGWHTTQKKMFTAEEMSDDQLTLLPTGQFINVSGSSTLRSTIYPQDKFIPLQYTGLRDKNGKEIFEGDILTYHDSCRFLDDDSEGNEISSVRWKDQFLSWSCQNEMLCDTEEPEIIGNVYENPELLKESEVGKQ